jgi:hypothetical protein
MSAHYGREGCAMKRTVLRILVFGITLAFVALIAQAEETKITGYQPGEFAVKGTIEQQLTTQVVDKIKSKLAIVPNGDLRIYVIGYADQLGSAHSKDLIGRDRAEAVQSYLLTKFPKATIIYYSKGDEADSRMVILYWNVTNPVPQPQPGKRDTRTLPLIGGGILVIIALVVLVHFAKTNVQPAAVVAPPLPAESAAEKSPGLLKLLVCDVEQRGRRYVVIIKQMSDGCYTGLPKPYDFRREPRDARKAVVSFLKNPANDAAIEQSIADGTIELKEEESTHASL